MSNRKVVRPVALAVGAALASTFAIANVASADTVESPFTMSALSAGYMLGAGEGACGGDKEGNQGKEGEGTCGEGSCGGDKEGGEATCGGDKGCESHCGGDKEGEASCGGDKDGEASCGGDKEAEGKCGEGSCGGSV